MGDMLSYSKFFYIDIGYMNFSQKLLELYECLPMLIDLLYKTFKVLIYL